LALVRRAGGCTIATVAGPAPRVGATVVEVPVGAGLAFVCVGGLIGLTVGVLIGALILRAAVWCANKCLPKPQSAYYDDEDDYDRERDDDDDFDRPRLRRRGRGPSTAIPEPDFGRACLIVFVNLIIQFGLGFVLGMMAGAAGAGADGLQMIQVLSYVLGFFISATVYTSMLPTTFGRASLVVLFQYLIVIAIAIIVVVPIVLALGLQFRGL
jgi:hypothetical protein